MNTIPMPPGFQWESPPVELPLRAVGAIVMDARHQTVATCPNGSLADVIAFTINEALCPQVHR